VNKNTLWYVAIALSIVGIFLALYLINLYYAFSPGSETICNINNRFNCTEISSGSLSTIFGVPVALVGLTGYVVILFSALTKKKTWMFFMSAFGMLFCLRITILEVFFVKILCPVCLACQSIMIILFLIATYLLFSKLEAVDTK
jgi:uncharacterized membrane protein